VADFFLNALSWYALSSKSLLAREGESEEVAVSPVHAMDSKLL
jgi:hypothetical protein